MPKFKQHRAIGLVNTPQMATSPVAILKRDNGRNAAKRAMYYVVWFALNADVSPLVHINPRLCTQVGYTPSMYPYRQIRYAKRQ